jgi:uncharacterized RDD family membrane protein YckC
MANVFDQVQAPPFPPGAVPSGPERMPDRVWGYAGFWWRVLAWVIDSVILSAVTFLIDSAVGLDQLAIIRTSSPVAGRFDISYTDAAQASYQWHMPAFGWAQVIGLLLPIVYYAVLESSRWQATLGKRLCRLRVTRLDGGRISLARALGRYFGKFLSAFIFGIGFLMVAWTRRRQGLHDLLAGTLVVRLRPPSDLVRFNAPPS